MTTLPYHCPKLAGDYLHSPCEKNLTRGREHREKFPHAIRPYPMDYCEQCGGKELVTREVPSDTHSPLEGGELLMNELLLEVSHPTPLKNAAAESQGHPTCPVIEPMEVLPEKEKQQMTSPRCPKHPAEPQIACSDTGKRAGQYLGACKVCMMERQLNKKSRKVKEKMTPAVARDLFIVEPVRQNAPGPPAINVQNPDPAPKEKPSGLELLLDFTDYPEVWDKLQADAKNWMRTPALQAIYFIKANRV